ncbi:metal tolerance protein C4 [Selaginella moellendorffii]|nr:metal tolerance protein C4 [Selaginella moellendorffii]|eukprot:XP_002989026.2 metal tolerance protein C4 [Selaginella moellendorffii]
MLSSLISSSRARVCRCAQRCRGLPGRSLLGEECGEVFGIRRSVLVSCYRKEADLRKSDGREENSNARPPLTYFIAKYSRGSFRFEQRRFHNSGTSHRGEEEEQESDPQPAVVHGHSERAVVTALWCNFLVLSLKCGVWFMTGSHVMLAEAVHSLADLANQGLLAYGLVSSKRAPDALHPYGYSKERFVWSLISAVGIFCLGSGATIVHGISNLWQAEPIDNIFSAAIVIGGSMLMEGASLYVAVNAVRQGAASEGMKFQEYIWRGHDPTSVAVMMEDGAAVTGLFIAAMSLTAVHLTGNPIWDPLGSILVGNLLGMVAVFLIQRNRHALLGRSMEPKDVQRVLDLLASDPVVDAVYDCKSEVIGPGSYRFKAEIDFDGVVVVHNYLQRTGREAWIKEFQNAAKDPAALETALANYGEEVVAALGSEVDRLEKDIQKIVPGVRHVDIEAHNPKGPLP